ncbi:hypothetical protein [Vibrio parahaemolyticus]|uniref:hypothetical protein n=1 Tax=Vibrio parahaemolyticus TaxID=670 RepID=UPI00040AC11A|nr:hypothetical protein [Vibrio parahaemolyticus]
MTNRDDFTEQTKRSLAERVGYRCSNPDCLVDTVGAKGGCTQKVAKIGVAAHITAAAEGGPRYNPYLTSEERKGTSNGIWLCQSCSVLIDRDELNYTVELINDWKLKAESEANARIGNRQNSINYALFHQAESSRVEKFIEFIYDLFYEFESGKGSLSVDVYYVDKQVFYRVLNIDSHEKIYKRDLLSYDTNVQETQNAIMDIIKQLRDFYVDNNYYELSYSFKLLEDCQYCYSQGLQEKADIIQSKLKKLGDLVGELHRFRERR